MTMFDEMDGAFFARRALEERKRAELADHPIVRRAHRDLAIQYERRIRDIAAGRIKPNQRQPA
jgi:hypothetical protein